MLKIATQCFDVHSLTQCPICKENVGQNIEPAKNGYNNRSIQAKTENQLHIVKHFQDELYSHLEINKDEGSFLCLMVRNDIYGEPI